MTRLRPAYDVLVKYEGVGLGIGEVGIRDWGLGIRDWGSRD